MVCRWTISSAVAGTSLIVKQLTVNKVLYQGRVMSNICEPFGKTSDSRWYKMQKEFKTFEYRVKKLQILKKHIKYLFPSYTQTLVLHLSILRQWRKICLIYLDSSMQESVTLANYFNTNTKAFSLSRLCSLIFYRPFSK